jgi:hypothetical protein
LRPTAAGGDEAVFSKTRASLPAGEYGSSGRLAAEPPAVRSVTAVDKFSADHSPEGESGKQDWRTLRAGDSDERTTSCAKDTRGADRLVPPPTPASAGLRVGDASSGGATSSPADRLLRGQHDSLIISIARACSTSKSRIASIPGRRDSAHMFASSPRHKSGGSAS